MPPTPITAATLAQALAREFIELCGLPKSGKSYAVLSLARSVQILDPAAKVYIIDTEDGILKLWQNAFPDVGNVSLYRCAGIDEVLDAFEAIRAVVKPGDWLCTESMSRVWSYAQDMGYEAVTGIGKSKYLANRTTGQPVTPQPDQLWQVVRNLHNRQFMDVINHELVCNVLLTTTVSQRPVVFERGESARTRQQIRDILGVNIVPEGEPRNAFYPDTIVLMEKRHDGYWATIIGDRGYDKPGQANISFQVSNFWLQFRVEAGRVKP